MALKLLYNLFIVPLGLLVFYVVSLVNKKARRGLKGRENLFSTLAKEISRLQPDAKRVWFHSSSMGEFEQAKPIIAELKRRYPTIETIVTFFSPSGYEHLKNYKLADVVSYIPFDTAKCAKEFIRLVRPIAAVMVRYDVWPNYLWALREAGVPTFIVSATLRKNTVRKFPVIKHFHTEMYNALDYILAVSENDKKLFQQFSLTHPHLEVVGDTRYDQVWQRSMESRKHCYLPSNVWEKKRVFVIGSSWEEDENALFPAIENLLKRHSNLLVVLVPHEPHLEVLERIEKNLNNVIPSIRFSTLNDYRNESIIIVDSVGILMALYQYADVVFVGGGFRQGVHSVLEPAAYGVPIVIGPKHHNSQEAVELVKIGAARVVKESKEIFYYVDEFLRDEECRKKAGEKAAGFVRNNRGATERVLSYLEKVL